MQKPSQREWDHSLKKFTQRLSHPPVRYDDHHFIGASESETTLPIGNVVFTYIQLLLLRCDTAGHHELESLNYGIMTPGISEKKCKI